MEVIQSHQDRKVVIDGREVIQLCSNNYLGLANHPALKKAAIEAIEQYGAGTASVRAIAGTFDIHVKLEKKLAAFKGTEDSVLFPSGFSANVGVLTSLLKEEDVVISDELNHASIIDGIRLCGATKRIYRHSDMGDLKKALQEHKNKKQKLIITDGVFSMDGDVAKLPEIVQLAEEYQALVMVDDAHASGVLGKNGRGTVDYYSLHGRVAIQVGTLSKAIGVLGGYVATSRDLCDKIKSKARPYLFTTSLPPSVVASCQAALDLLIKEPERIQALWENAHYFKKGLTNLGFDVGNTETPIIPIRVGEEETATRFSQRLLEEGIYTLEIRFPMVGKGKARLRTIVTAAHRVEDLDKALLRFAQVGKELKVI